MSQVERTYSPQKSPRGGTMATRKEPQVSSWTWEEAYAITQEKPMATTREEPTWQYWRVTHHNNLRGDPGHCTSIGSPPQQIETHHLCQSSRPHYQHQRRVTSAQLENSPLNFTTWEEHSHTMQLHRSSPSSTREEAPMPQLKRRGCAKIREQAHKYRTWKECLCTSLPERKSPPQFERNTPLQLWRFQTHFHSHN